MISVAIKLGNVDELRNINELKDIEQRIKQKETKDDYDKLILNASKEFCKVFSFEEVDRIYFGPEFCQNMIPDVKELDMVIDYAITRKLKLTLVTPIVTDVGINRIRALFEDSYNIGYIDEVVFNDWGVFQMLQEWYPDIHYICGRLLDKTQRDSRIQKERYEEFFSKEGLDYLRSPAFTSPAYQRVLEKKGISQVEIDSYPQGLKLKREDIVKINLALWYPFGYLTTGRTCIINMLDRSETQKFTLEYGCQKKCKYYTRMLYKRQGTFNLESSHTAYDVNVFGKGNTIFYVYDNLETVIKEHKDVISRVVYQPFLDV